MSEQEALTPIRQQMLDGVRFNFTIASNTGGWEPAKAANEMYDSGLLYARLAKTEPTEEDMHFLYDCILQALVQLYPHNTPSALLEVMRQAFSESD